MSRATTKGIRLLTLVNGMASQPRWNSDMAAFREEFAKAEHVVILTGAGVSAESGVPTFRGAGGYWRRWQAQVCLLNFISESKHKKVYNHPSLVTICFRD